MPSHRIDGIGFACYRKAMYCSKFDHDLFYSVQPGDSLTKIARNQFGIGTTKESSQEVARIFSMNPQIKDPNRIFPGDLILLGSPARSRMDRSLYPQDMVELQQVWKRASPETKETIQKNFDLIDWLSDRNDQADFLNTSAEETATIWRSVQPFRTAVKQVEILKFSKIYEELVVVRNETIVLLSQYRLSVSRMPFFLISVQGNGLYNYAKKLARMVELSKRFQMGKVLIAADILLESAKVARVAIHTRDVRATSRQVAKSTGKIAVAAGAARLAQYGCRTLIQINKIWGGGTCVILVGVGIWGGQGAGQKAGEGAFDLVEKYVLPPLQ